MPGKKVLREINKITADLSNSKSYKLTYLPQHGKPLPSMNDLDEIVRLCRRILFPGYFGDSTLKPDTISHYIGVNVDRLFSLLWEQVRRGLCFDCEQTGKENPEVESISRDIAARFISRLPALREMLSKDVKAAYDGDPAAKSFGEIVFCYPSIRMLTNHRIAHELLKLEVPLIPRIISEMAHSETGIDIHPGAQIGDSFFIDHGTGVVIGETCIIGKNVKLYQGVTLGAKSFPKDQEGNPVKGIPRHPIIEDGVVIYAHATVLGRITVGRGSTIGANVWVMDDVAPKSKVLK